jgi:hypothetical protein
MFHKSLFSVEVAWNELVVQKKFTGLLNQVLLTPRSDIPGTRIKRYLGPVQLHFIKDAWTVRGEGQLGSFFHLLLSEVNAVARAHVAALGGNALLCHNLVPQEAGGKASRNQGYTMFSVTGDAVLLEFFVPLNLPSGTAPAATAAGDIGSSSSPPGGAGNARLYSRGDSDNGDESFTVDGNEY